ncbi:glycogen debranching protein GlgX [Cetobacterium sp. SF1]|uniref:glycogen debranching protein GlgX n=1 Tax=Cetobacterium sp. SF1 TaxID=3417654 RepID=UPI003CF56444
MREFKAKLGYFMKGATVFETGVNFSIFSKNAFRVTLEIFEKASDDEPIYIYDLNPSFNKIGDTWYVFIEGVKEGDYYTWRVDGPYKPKEGHIFDYNLHLLDPYAKAITPAYFKESFKKCLIVNSSKFLNLEEDIRPCRDFKDTIIYEMHIKLFTMNKNSLVIERGTYLGILEKIDYLKELGITAVELLPVFSYEPDDLDRKNPLTGENLRDVWGYNPIGFFSPSSNYITNLCENTVTCNQLAEFRTLVAELHKAGIEIILDVVFNHTGEGNEKGPIVSFKGLDNSIYYILEKDNKEKYCNYSGTGNTLNVSHPVVKELILDSLRYWYGVMNVDGFRFDLAAILGRDADGNWIGDLSLLKDISNDPILSKAKLIAEGWDAAGGYFLGEFPYGWAEWNGKFRDTVRKFIRGDKGQVWDLAIRIAGSPDLFGKSGREPYSSINFVTAHDGFTMWDLVSYNEKHNLENGENNLDGENNNNSWNCGIEGMTQDINIIRLRKRQVKNFIVILMVSQGVPMILMGDEMAKTQYGNNNAYCQDNENNWLDWSRLDKFSDIFYFYKKMIEFRKNYNCLKRNKYFENKDSNGNGLKDISWHGVNLNQPDWSYDSHSLAFLIDGLDENNLKGEHIYVALNSYHEKLRFEIPYIPGQRWYVVVDTYNEEKSFSEEDILLDKNYYDVQGRSSIILISK